MLVKIKDGVVETYPYSEKQFRVDNKNVSFPSKLSDELLAEYGVFRVGFSSTPEYDNSTHKLVETNDPVMINGKWVINKLAVPFTEEELDRIFQHKCKRAREKRDNLLLSCDWTQVSDAQVNQEAWAVYRQALRDVTLQEGFPENITWPTKPE